MKLARLVSHLPQAGLALVVWAGGGFAPPSAADAAGDAGLVCSGSVAGRKQAYFGDLHAHSNYSLDVYAFNAINDPTDAYRFAKGEPAGLPDGDDDPYTQKRTIGLDRPYDFAALTEHAEYLGGWVYACEGGPLRLPQGINPICNFMGGQIRANIRSVLAGEPSLQIQILRVLSSDGPTNRPAWADIKRINDEEYEPCKFTTIPAYDHAAIRGDQHLQRNVYFLGDELPDDVFTSTTPDYLYTDDNLNDEWRLFDHLKSACLDVDGCDVFTIPYNFNISTGRAFLPRDPSTGVPVGRDGRPLTETDAKLRARLDRALEIMQHKGASECAGGLFGGADVVDPACTFEQIKNVCRGGPNDPALCATYCPGNETDPSFCSLRFQPTYAVDRCERVGPNQQSGPGPNCAAPLDMARDALAEGLAIGRSLGVNPYRLGFIGGIDTHNGTPGLVAEQDWPGHAGVLDNDPRDRLGAWVCEGPDEDPSDPANCTNRFFDDYFRAYNPGGVTGVWAEENTREQIWHGIHRGETFATSGPRLRIRTLASWDEPPADVCERLAAGESPIDTGALEGARMGGDLPPRTGGGGPWIVAWATKDSGGESLPLQRLDIVKASVGEDGEPRIQLFEGVDTTPAPVVPPSRESCGVTAGDHPGTLCAVWRDAELDAGEDAYYYARALEVPSCRWDTRWCTEARADCGLLDPANGMFPLPTGLRGFEGCCRLAGEPGTFSGTNRFTTVEERAWASPIWYAATPAKP